MEDACYICHRTQTDLDRLNEEIRTRVYLAYFANTRNQIDDQRRKISFLQRLKDEESGDPHFRINAAQVFGDPPAYEKLMPWIDRLIEIVRTQGGPVDEKRTIGELVDHLLLDEKHLAAQLEQGLDQLRTRFATSGKVPVSLGEYTLPFPVEWSVEGASAKWRASPASDLEPLRHVPGDARSTVDVKVHLCSICRLLTEVP
jgi:hypothetical protein